MIRGLVALLVMTTPLAAETLVAARTLPARSIIGPADVLLREGDVAGTVQTLDGAVGLEARVALYAGRPIRPGDLGPPAIVERNQIVMLVYQHGAITISTEGRALDRAGPGDVIRVMNLSSRATVGAQITTDGTALVTQ